MVESKVTTQEVEMFSGACPVLSTVMASLLASLTSADRPNTLHLMKIAVA